MPQRALQVSTDPWRSLAYDLRAALLFVVLSAAALLGNTLQMVSVPLRLASASCFRWFNHWLVATWWAMTSWLVENIAGMRPRITGQFPVADGNYILIANHQAMSDIVAILMFARRNQSLERLNWFVKDSLKHMPAIGWGLRFLDTLFVKREWYKDAARIQETFAKITQKKLPVWLISFPEGTRVSSEKIATSQAFAKQKRLQIPVLRYVILPRSKGFVASVEGLTGHIRGVIDLTIAYERGVPSVWQMLRGDLKSVHIDVRSFPIEDLPSQSEQLSQWLTQRFVEKDRRLAQFYQRGTLE